jgi:hypothetical protein
MTDSQADRKRLIQSLFPKLELHAFEIVGGADRAYNCIAWAAGDTTRWWWPGGVYWPDGVPCERTLAAFTQAFGTLGYVPCDGHDLEQGVEKVAIYAQSQVPKRAARQLPNGKWTSKLGGSECIEHEVDALEGPTYGQLVLIMRRPGLASQ